MTINVKDYFDKSYYEMEGVKSSYSTSNYNQSSYLYEAMIIWLNEFIPLAGKKILDNGCGYGFLLDILREHGFDAYGQEVSPYAISQISSSLSEYVLESEETEIAYENQFDLITHFHTLEHMDPTNVEIYLENLYAKTSSDGIVFSIIALGWNNDNSSLLDKSVRTLQPRSWWDRKFQAAGFIRDTSLEADAYEIGVQTPAMVNGMFLAREHNWHCFAYKKASNTNTSSGQIIYDRLLMPKPPNKPKALMVGSRAGTFEYPFNDFFHIDNWGNYLSYWFNIEYLGITPETCHNMNWNEYDIIFTTLDHTVLNLIHTDKSVLDAYTNSSPTKICFLDGTLPMKTDDPKMRWKILNMAKASDLCLATHYTEMVLKDMFNINLMHCSHIFPLRFFDYYYKPKKKDSKTFNILCAGSYDFSMYLSTLSAHFAAKFADKVFIGYNTDVDLELSKKGGIPDNLELFPLTTQDKFYSTILSNVNLVLKMDNIASVGRNIAEAAAAQVPAISCGDVYQMRCYPELMVNSFDDIHNIEKNINLVKANHYGNIGLLGRERLKASNEYELNQMMTALASVGFSVQRPRNLYW